MGKLVDVKRRFFGLKSLGWSFRYGWFKGINDVIGGVWFFLFFCLVCFIVGFIFRVFLEVRWWY